MSSQIHQEIAFNVSAKRVYEALTDARQFSKVTGGVPTTISPEAGGAFSCFGGMITGRSIELATNQRIVLAWRVSNWPVGEYSIVKIELQEEGSVTKLVLDHKGFPEGAQEHLEPGWKANYWEPLQKFLG